MDDEEKTTSRNYRVILTDRTTSPKVNRYIRDLTGMSVWEASSMMNTVPATILKNIPLHKAIEIKSALGKFGLSAAIENVENISAEKDEPVKASVLPEKIVRKPAVSSEPKIKAVVHDDKIATANRKFTPESPARLISRHIKRTPVFWMVFPFIILLIIVIIILYVGEKGTLEKILPLPKDNIAQHQESGEELPQKRFIRSQEDILAQLKESQKSMSSPPPISPIEGGRKSAGDAPSTDQSQSPGYSDMDSRSLDKPNPSGADIGSSAGNNAGQGGDAAKNNRAASVKGLPGNANAGKGQSGQGSSPGNSGKSSSISSSMISNLSFVGPKESGGISPEKLDAIVDHVRDAVNNNNKQAVADDFLRLKLANEYKNDLPLPVAKKLNAPDLQSLKNDLKDIYERYLLEEDLKFYPELTGATIKIHTNLPDKSKLLVQLNLPGSKKALEYPAQVDEGIIELPHSGGYPSGLIAVRIILLPVSEQTAEVIDVIGTEGANLLGRLNDGKGNIEYNGYLNNRIARSRGDIGKEDSAAELYQLAITNGMDDFRLDDFEEYINNEKIFITISANVDDEENFLMQACRSVGMMTAEMDSPPLYLRLVMNGAQYFIPTFKCRVLLREYREDDPAAIDYLINSFLTF